MANLYEAGIVITADTQPSVEAIGSLIDVVSTIETSMREFEAIRGFGNIEEGALAAGEAANEFLLIAESADSTANAMSKIVGGAQAARDDIIILVDEFGNLTAAGPEAMAATQEAAENLDQEIRQKGEDVAELGEDFQELKEEGTDAFDSLIEGLGPLTEGFLGLGDAIIGLVSSGFFQLDQQAARLHGRLGEGKAAMDGFKSSVLAVSDATEIAPEIIGDLAYNMRSAGLAFEASSGQVGDSEKTLAHMVGTLGMSVDEVTLFAARAKMMGASVGDLANDVAKFEKQYKIPELLEELPGITEDVMKTQALYGKFTVKDAKSSSLAVAKMAGVYKKALGYTAVQAAKAAREQFVAFSGEVSSMEDVFLGLADGFTPLQMAFLEVGGSIDGVSKLMQKAQEDPFAIANAAEEVGKRWGFSSHQYRRFHKQLLQGLPEEQKMLQMRIEQLQREGKSREEIAKIFGAEQAEKDKAAEKQKAFDQMISGARDNVVELYQRFQALWRAFQTTAALEFGEGLKAGFETLIRWVARAGFVLKDFIGFMKGSDSDIEEYGATFKWVAGVIRSLFTGEETDRVSRFSKIVGIVTAASVGLGTALGALGAVFGPIAAAIGPVWKIMGKVWDIFQKFRGTIKATGTGLGRFRGVLKILGGVIKKLAWPIGAAIALFDGFKDRMGDIGDAIKEGRWGDVFDEVLGGVIDSVDAFFLGLPGKFVEGFKSMGQSVSTDAAADFGKSIGDFLGKGLVAITDWFSGTLIPWFSETGMPWISDNLFSGDFWIDLGLKVLGGFAALGEQIFAALGGIAEGILNAFGLPFESLGPMMEIVWIKIKKTIEVTIMTIGDLIMQSVTGWKIIFSKAVTAIAEMWIGFTTSLSNAWIDFKIGIVEGMMSIVQSAIAGADALGLNIETLEKAQQSLLGTQLDYVREQKASTAAAEETKKVLQAMHKTEVDGYLEEQKAREAATDAVAKQYDEEVEKKQEELNRLAELRAQEQAAAQQAGIQQMRAADEAAKGAPTPAELPNPEDVAATRLKSKKELRKFQEELIVRGGGEGDVAGVMQDLKTLMGKLSADQQKALLGGIGGDAGALPDVFAKAGLRNPADAQRISQMLIKIAPTDKARDHITKFLTAWEVEAVDGGQ